MYRHYTDSRNIASILEAGLAVGCDPVAASVGVEWVLAFYDENPVYLTTVTSPFVAAYTETEWAENPYFEVDVRGLSLVADLPCLVDIGARYADGMMYVGGNSALKELLEFADADGWIEIEHLLDPQTDVARIAIRLTGTAACIDSIPADRLTLVEVSPAPSSPSLRP